MSEKVLSVILSDKSGQSFITFGLQKNETV
jgi:hypothetical protein